MSTPFPFQIYLNKGQNRYGLGVIKTDSDQLDLTTVTKHPTTFYFLNEGTDGFHVLYSDDGAYYYLNYDRGKYKLSGILSDDNFRFTVIDEGLWNKTIPKSNIKFNNINVDEFDSFFFIPLDENGREESSEKSREKEQGRREESRRESIEQSSEQSRREESREKSKSKTKEESKKKHSKENRESKKKHSKKRSKGKKGKKHHRSKKYMVTNQKYEPIISLDSDPVVGSVDRSTEIIYLSREKDGEEYFNDWSSSSDWSTFTSHLDCSTFTKDCFQTTCDKTECDTLECPQFGTSGPTIIEMIESGPTITEPNGILSTFPPDSTSVGAVGQGSGASLTLIEETSPTGVSLTDANRGQTVQTTPKQTLQQMIPSGTTTVSGDVDLTAINVPDPSTSPRGGNNTTENSNRSSKQSNTTNLTGVWVSILVGIVVLVILAIAGYYLYRRSETPDTPPTTSIQTKPIPPVPPRQPPVRRTRPGGGGGGGGTLERLQSLPPAPTGFSTGQLQSLPPAPTGFSTGQLQSLPPAPTGFSTGQLQSLPTAP